MNSLTIPPSTNWYLPNTILCTPDNTLIYGSRSDIVIMFNEESELLQDRPPSVKILPRVHSQKIISVSINRNWAKPNKFLVSAAEDRIIKLWNLDTYERKLINDSFAKHDDRLVGALFAGDDRIICVTEAGLVTIWNIVLNEEMQLRNDLFTNFGKVTVTCFSVCPHANWLAAFGMKSGLIFIVDLRRNGKVLHKLRGHDKAVVSLVWCPIPFNIFPQKPNNFVQFKKKEEIITEEMESTDSETVHTNIEPITKEEPQEKPSEEKEAETKPVKKPKKANPWTNLKHADDDEQIDEPPVEETTITETNNEDFLSECRDLRAKILNTKSDNEDECDEIKVKQEKRNEIKDTLSTENSNDSNEASGSNINDNINEEQVQEGEKVVENVEQIDGNVSAKEIPNDELSVENEKIETIAPKNEQEEPRKEYLLASSARESKVYIWRAGTDGRMQTFLTVPNKNNRKMKQIDKIWTVLSWPNPNSLLVSTKHGELLKFLLPRQKNADKSIQTVHHDHHASVLNIVPPQMFYNENNDFENLVKNVWSVGQDRLLLNTDIIAKENLNIGCIPMNGGAATVLLTSPLNPSLIAFGTSDGVIKVWNLSLPNERRIIMNKFQQKIMSKVTALAWHPTNEFSLAFSTVEGRIGLLKVSAANNSATILDNYFKESIHNLEYGPLNGNLEEFGLYAVSEGKLGVFDVQHPDKKINIVEIPENTQVYMFTWHPNRKHMLLNTKTGSILIYSADLQIISTQYVQQKCHKFVWHPDAYNLNGDSKYKNYFAVTINSKEFVIYNLEEDVDGKWNLVKMCKLENGHCDFINCIAWSPFNGQKIVSVGEDGFAQVWDIETKSIESTFVNPTYDSIYAVLWSPISADYIILGCKNHTLIIYNVNEYKSELNIDELASKRSKAIKKINEESNFGISVKEKPAEKQTKPSKVCLLPTFYNAVNDNDLVNDMKLLLDWKKTGKSETNGKFGIFNVFGESEDMIKLLDFNEIMHKTKGKYSFSGHISLFKGDVNTFVKEAIDEKRVTPWIITVAPMASHKLWLSACETYAAQLMDETDSDPLQVVSYLLITHKIPEALEFLCEKQLHREALALAKARKCDNETINGIIEKWAKYLVYTGMFELAAQCYIYLGELEQAASVLFRRSDVGLLNFAIELALECKNDELYKAIKFRHDSFAATENEENIPKEEESLNKDITNSEEVCSGKVEEN